MNTNAASVFDLSAPGQSLVSEPADEVEEGEGGPVGLAQRP